MNVRPFLLPVSLASLTGMAGTPWRAASADDLVQRATDSIGDIIQVQFQRQSGSNIHDLYGNSYTSIVQPAIPFDLRRESVPNFWNGSLVSFPGIRTTSVNACNAFTADVRI